MNTSEQSELDDLIARLRDGSLSDDQVRRLDDLLSGDPAACDHYAGMVSLICDLRHYHNRSGGRRLWMDGTCELETVSPDDLACLSHALVAVGNHDERAHFQASRWRLAGWAVAAMLVIGLGALAWMGLQSGHSGASSQGVVRLAGSHQAMWGEPAASDLSSPLILNAGLAVLQLGSGVEATLEGPAQAQWLGDGRLKLDRGRLHVRLDGTVGRFEVLTPLMHVVDEGTAFGLEAGEDGSVELHVLEGRVSYQSITAMKSGEVPAHRLLAGFSVRAEADGKIASMNPAPRRFVTAAEASDPAQLSLRLNRRDWSGKIETFSSRPQTLLAFTPDENWRGKLENKAPASGLLAGGQIFGAKPGPGRWEGKQSLAFSRPGDHVALRIDGEHRQLTMAAWVWIEKLNRTFTALVMSDNWSLNHPHWQIGGTGQLILGVNGSDVGDFKSAAGTIHDSMLRKWIHLAVVYDADAGRVRHYLDGRRVVEIPFQSRGPLVPESVRIGDWMGHRTLNGRIDELFVLDRAADDREIVELYELGRKVTQP